MKPSQLVKAIQGAMALNRPAMIWGPPGVGKSDIVAQVASSDRRELRDVRMSQMDPTDIKGFPAPDAKANIMRWLPPDFFPVVTDKKKGVLFLDELASAPTAVQASGYQLIWNRAVGSYKLPPGWYILAAGNREGDGSVTYRMPKALANRFLHFELDVHLGEWIDYANASGYEFMIPAFHKFKGGEDGTASLLNFEPASRDHAYPSPRTWQMVDEVLKQKLDSGTERQLIEAAIGPGAAADFVSFLQIARELPSRDEILLNPQTAALPDKVAARHAVAMMLVRDINDVSYAKAQEYMNRMSVEFQAIFNIGALKTNRKIQFLPEFTAWANDHHDVIAGGSAPSR